MGRGMMPAARVAPGMMAPVGVVTVAAKGSTADGGAESAADVGTSTAASPALLLLLVVFAAAGLLRAPCAKPFFSPAAGGAGVAALSERLAA
jgi:hypothetical protein